MKSIFREWWWLVYSFLFAKWIFHLHQILIYPIDAINHCDIHWNLVCLYLLHFVRFWHQSHSSFYFLLHLSFHSVGCRMMNKHRVSIEHHPIQQKSVRKQITIVRWIFTFFLDFLQWKRSVANKHLFHSQTPTRKIDEWIESQN